MKHCKLCKGTFHFLDYYHSEIMDGDVCYDCYRLTRKVRPPRVYAIIGLRCSGKSTIIHQTSNQIPFAHPSKRVTTRRKRIDEIEGDHLFMTEEGFKEMKGLIHTFRYHQGYMVGFPHDEIILPLKMGYDVLLTFTDFASFKAMEKEIPMDSVLISVPKNDILKRLKMRSGESSMNSTQLGLDSFELSLNDAQGKFKHWIDNSDGNQDLAVEKLKEIILKDRLNYSED